MELKLKNTDSCGSPTGSRTKSPGRSLTLGQEFHHQQSLKSQRQTNLASFQLVDGLYNLWQVGGFLKSRFHGGFKKAVSNQELADDVASNLTKVVMMSRLLKSCSMLRIRWLLSTLKFWLRTCTSLDYVYLNQGLSSLEIGSKAAVPSFYGVVGSREALRSLVVHIPIWHAWEAVDLYVDYQHEIHDCLGRCIQRKALRKKLLRL